MCGIVGIINTDRSLIDGSHIRNAICTQKERGNGLGGGFAAYGIYPDQKNCYALHVMYEGDRHCQNITAAESCIEKRFRIYLAEEIPAYPNRRIARGPCFKRYFVKPIMKALHEGQTEDDYVVETVMMINSMEKSFVISSGKNMGVFKGLGSPENIADYFRIEDYSAYIWIAHDRFPTGSPGWWGGAHPLALLDKAVVHNGVITSYGTNQRYLETHGYSCRFQTDTEVVGYIFDKLTRKDGLSKEDACYVIAPSLWEEIDRLDDDKKRTLRIIYGPAVINGTFGLVLAHEEGAIVLNDRKKQKPLYCARAGDTYYASSEECSIRHLNPDVEEFWSPPGGEPFLINLMQNHHA